MPVPLDRIEDAIYDAGLKRTEAKEKLERILSEYGKTRNLLHELRKEIRSYEQVRKGVQVASTVTSTACTIATTVAFVAAGFFTSGATWLFGAATLASTAVKITNFAVNIIKSKHYSERFTSIIANLERHEKDAQECMRPLNIASDLIEKCFKLDSEKAWNSLNTFLARVSYKSPTFMGSTCIFIVTLSLLASSCSADPKIAAKSIEGIFRSIKNLFKDAQDAKLIFTEAFKDTTEYATKESVTAAVTTVGSISVGLGVIFTAIEIVNLIKDLKSGNPTVQHIDELDKKLYGAEKNINQVLKNLEDEADEEELRTEIDGALNDLENEANDTDDDSSSSDEEEEKLKIYDISPSTLGNLPRRSDIETNLFSNVLPRPEDIMRKIREFLAKMKQQSNYSYRLSLYLYIVSAIEELICQQDSAHIKFQRSEQSDHAQVTVNHEKTSVLFDKEARNDMRDSFFPIHELLLKVFELNREECKGLCVIYRIRCKLCKDVNYVGQTIDLAKRIGQHELGIWNGFMDHDDGTVNQDTQGPGLRPIYSHYSIYHRALGENMPFGEVYEVYICHRLQEYSERAHSKIRRSMEIYYQWLFKARTSEGGMSTR